MKIESTPKSIFNADITLCVIAGLTRNLLKIMGLRVKPAMTQSVFFDEK